MCSTGLDFHAQGKKQKQQNKTEHHLKLGWFFFFCLFVCLLFLFFYFFAYAKIHRELQGILNSQGDTDGVQWLFFLLLQQNP